MIFTEREFQNELDMLKGNINRIAVSEDVTEISDMFLFAKYRLSRICKARLDELNVFASHDCNFTPCCSMGDDYIPPCEKSTHPNAEELPFG